MSSKDEVKITEYTLGGKLMRSRTKKNLDITKVAHKLKISTTYLQAIEDGNLELLPESAYVIGFIRAYADLLSLKSDPLVAEYKEIISHKTPKKYYVPQAIEEEKNKHYIYIIAGIILITFTIWIATNKLLNKTESILPPSTQPSDVSETLEPPVTVVEVESAIENSQQDIKTVVPDAPQIINAKQEEPTVTQKPIQKTVKKSTPEKIVKKPVKKKTPKKAFTIQLKPSDTIVLTAKSITYINIFSLSNRQLFNGFLDAGQTVAVPLDGGYKITAREANKLKITIVQNKNKKTFSIRKKGVSDYSLNAKTIIALTK